MVLSIFCLANTTDHFCNSIVLLFFKLLFLYNYSQYNKRLTYYYHKERKYFIYITVYIVNSLYLIQA